jgi:hypothetical protein
MMMNIDTVGRWSALRERAICKSSNPGQELTPQHNDSLSHAILHLQ